MRTLIIPLAIVACTNEPQYVPCAPMGAAPNDLCRLEAGANMIAEARGSVHVPVKPEAIWDDSDRARRAELQMALDPAVEVPVYRLEHYELSVEWTVTNLEGSEGEFRIDLNGANEAYAWDPSLIMPPDPDDPQPPPLAGNIPIHVGPDGVVSGVFREDQLLEAAIDLDQISRGNVNPFAATLTVSKNAESFQPLTPTVYDPQSGNYNGGDPTGPAVPRAAFRQLVRVDMVFRPSRSMVMEFALRVRERVDVIHEMGLNAPAAELQIMDPPAYTP